MFQDAFVKLDENECKTVLDEINPSLKGGDFNPSTVTILGQEISFYPGYRFLEIANYESNPPFKKNVIYKPGDINVLDWTNVPIYALNESAPLGLSSLTVEDYVRFFFKYVRGKEGKFKMIENVDDIPWCEDPPPAARKAVSKLLQPLTILGKNEDSSFVLKACMTFRKGLYQVNIHVDKDGKVSSSEHEVLIDDLPLIDDTLSQ